jgi:mannose-6-phosphate isomerase-like protein (cupin superfamily)
VIQNKFSRTIIFTSLFLISLPLFCGFEPKSFLKNREHVKVKRILDYEKSGSQRTAIDEVELAAGSHLPLQGFPEERLYYILDGRGVISIYEESPRGDIYELRQDVSVYMTPGIKHEILNIGDRPLVYVIFLVKGGIAPEGELSWSAVSQRGVTVDKPKIGSGVAVTKVFDEGSNPSKEEGLHLRIRDIWLRRPQKFANAEVLTVAPGRSTRLHTHHDTGETCYILYGEGNFVWDDKKIPFKAGSSISYPVGVLRKVENTGSYPMSYICISSLQE